MRHVLQMFRTLLSMLMLLTLCSQLAFAKERQVALELVLAVDTSTSVDTREFMLQRDGFAKAFVHPELVSIIEGLGTAGIAVTLIEWAGTNRQKTIADWTLLTDRTSSLGFAAQLAGAPRSLHGMTDIGSVISHSIASIENNGFEGYRKVIDISGDGSSNISPARQRDRAIASGITINGLIIFNDDYDLGQLAEIDLVQHYTNQVIGGSGAFLMTANGFEDFRTTILNKLKREILGSGIAGISPQAGSAASLTRN